MKNFKQFLLAPSSCFAAVLFNMRVPKGDNGPMSTNQLQLK